MIYRLLQRSTVLLGICALGACGGPDTAFLIENCTQEAGYSEAVCECAADRLADNISADNIDLLAEVTAKLEPLKDADDPFATAMRADAALKKIAADRDMSYPTLGARMQTIGTAWQSAQQTCLK